MLYSFLEAKMEDSRHFFVFEYGFGSFGVAADTVKEAREIFRKRMEGELDLSKSIPPQEDWEKLNRKQRRLQKFKDSGLDIDLIEPTVY
jgi:hypothetical protein